jgi:pimeloyl-ACP methyl ester carboxylesterase
MTGKNITGSRPKSGRLHRVPPFFAPFRWRRRQRRCAPRRERVRKPASSHPRRAPMAVAVLCGFPLFCALGCAHFRPAADLDSPPPVQVASGVSWESDFSDAAGLNYVLTFPRGHGEQAAGSRPMIIFLHSMEERGSEVAPLFVNPAGQGVGLAGFALQRPEFPFVTLSPLCPSRTFWYLLHGRLDRLLEDVLSRHAVDPGRVYLLGVSMGGMGVWSMAMAYPHRFAAAAPIAGGVYSPPMRRRFHRMVDVPIWAFHARGDPSIPLEKNRAAVEDLVAAGGNARITVLEGNKHYVQEEVFSDGGVFDWFLRNPR